MQKACILSIMNSIEHILGNEMQQPITVDKHSEFFICIAKDGIHSFLMLGVMDGKNPKLFARVGKGNKIDESFGTDFSQQLTMVQKALFSNTEATLDDEGITRRKPVDISYQAYSITYKQYLDFLKMTKNINIHQRNKYGAMVIPDKHSDDLTYSEEAVKKLRTGVSCYVPQNNEGKDSITFTYQTLNAEDSKQEEIISQQKKIIQRASTLDVSNTCRSTALDLLNYTLGYTPDVATLFAVGLNYTTTLNAGVPSPATFYILPPPPNCFKLSVTKMKILEVLYERLESIPKINPGAEGTRDKYDELKDLYKKISGEPDLPLNTLLDNIAVHRKKNNHIFNAHRGQSFVSWILQFFGAKTATQQALDRIEKWVKEQIEKNPTECKEENDSHNHPPPKP